MQVSFTNRFEKDIHRLAKRYRKIRLDIQLLIQQLEAGELPVDQIPNLNQTVFKVRLKNSDIKKGKSAQAIKATLSEVAKHYLEESVWAKVTLIYLDKMSETPDQGA
ncbi:MAG: hypothetical protein AAFX95_13050 [Cyanobacteria bacterium J06639_16]